MLARVFERLIVCRANRGCLTEQAEKFWKNTFSQWGPRGLT